MPSRFEYERAVRESDLAPLSRLLALTIATWADVRTGAIPDRLTPSLTTLESCTGMARGSVRTHLDNLEGCGWLLRDRPSKAAARAEKARTKYKIRVPRGAAVPDSDGNELGQDVTEPRAGHAPDGQELGQELPQARAGAALELGQEMYTTRAGAALSSSFSPTTYVEDQDKDSSPAAQPESPTGLWDADPDMLPATPAASVLPINYGDNWADPFDTHSNPAQAAAKVDGVDRFDEFWAAYPKRMAKQDARRAWLKALKGGDATAEQIITAATRYAGERQGQDPKFTPYPATWLNRGSYDDEPEPTQGAFLVPINGGAAQYPNTRQLTGTDARVAGWAQLAAELDARGNAQ